MGNVLSYFTLEQWLTLASIPIVGGAVVWAWTNGVIAFFEARQRRRQAEFDAALAAIDQDDG